VLEVQRRRDRLVSMGLCQECSFDDGAVTAAHVVTAQYPCVTATLDPELQDQ
jgi:hypothetical protein